MLFYNSMQRSDTEITSKILVVTQNLPPVICGVGDYTTHFTQELLRQQPKIKLAFMTRSLKEGQVNYAPDTSEPEFLTHAEIYRVAPLFWKVRDVPLLVRTVRQSRASSVHIHYVPQMYYRAGVGIALPFFVLILRLLGLRIIITFHELFIPWRPNFKQLIIGLIQRLNFLLLLLLTTEIVVTTDARATTMRRCLFWRPSKARSIVVAPVGSNFPNPDKLTPDRALLRQKWDLPLDALVLSCLGQLRWKEQLKWLELTLDEVEAKHSNVRLLLIGLPSELLPLDHSFRKRAEVICTGYRNATEVSELLSCTDIYLLPLEDGVSARRTALMAALQHGLPVVSTRGHNTEAAFLTGLPVLLSPTNDVTKFSKLAVELADDADKRRVLSHAAYIYYETHFSWKSIVQPQLQLFIGINKEVKCSKIV